MNDLLRREILLPGEFTLFLKDRLEVFWLKTFFYNVLFKFDLFLFSVGLDLAIVLNAFSWILFGSSPVTVSTEDSISLCFLFDFYLSFLVGAECLLSID